MKAAIESKEIVSNEIMADVIIDSMQDLKGSKIVKIDLQKVADAPAGIFIICEAESTVKIKGIVNRITENMREECGMRPGHVEGISGAKWMLIDYFSIIVHVFYPETRDFYDLEGLWSDGEITEYSSLS